MRTLSPRLKRVSGSAWVNSWVGSAWARTCLSSKRNRSENKRVPERDEWRRCCLEKKGKRVKKRVRSRNCVSSGRPGGTNAFTTISEPFESSPISRLWAPLRIRLLFEERRTRERASESCLGLSLWSVTPRQYAASSFSSTFSFSYCVIPQWSWSDSCVLQGLRGNETWKRVAVKKILRLRCSVRAIMRKVWRGEQVYCTVSFLFEVYHQSVLYKIMHITPFRYSLYEEAELSPKLPANKARKHRWYTRDTWSRFIISINIK